MQSSTGSAFEAIRRNALRMRKINRFTSSVAASLQQQIAAISEILHDAAGAATSTREVVGVFDGLASAVAKNCDTADTVLMAAVAVEAAAVSLSDKVETFLRGVAA